MGRIQKTEMLHLLPMIFVIFISLVFGATNTPSWAGEIATILEKAELEAQKITLPENIYDEEGVKAAKETAEVFNSPEFQEKVRCEEQRLEKEVFAGHIEPWIKKDKSMGHQKEQSTTLARAERVYLFLSSSVPDETIQAYIAAVAGTDDPNLVLVIRGWPSGRDGADTDTDTNYFSNILQKDPACKGTRTPCEHYQVGINLQPALFSQYGITQVPAVVFANGKTAYQIQGDASLRYLLERINREAKSDSLNKLINTIRKI
jgi:type-F conjugative transfer system pilin assembly protein TrbC